MGELPSLTLSSVKRGRLPQFQKDLIGKKKKKKEMNEGRKGQPLPESGSAHQRRDRSAGAPAGSWAKEQLLRSFPRVSSQQVPAAGQDSGASGGLHGVEAPDASASCEGPRHVLPSTHRRGIWKRCPKMCVTTFPLLHICSSV